MSSEQWKIDNADKMRQYRREWYHKNKVHAKKEIARRREELKAWMREFKAGLSCKKCGENHPAALQFHHLNPGEKDMNISETIHNGWSKKKIQKEMAKCIVLCANCHAKIHYEKD